MSRLARLSLANRSVVALVTVAIAVFGWFSLGSLKQELIPSLQIPTAVVVAVDPGSSPDLVEQQLTEPIEQALSSVDDVESVTSTSATSVSTTTVQLTYGVDVDARAQEIQRAVDRIRSSLPDGVEPSVFTGSIDDLPVVQLAVAGTPDDVREGEDPQAALARVVQDVVAPRLEQVPGVRDVAVTSVAEQAVTITLDLPALTAVGLSPTAVQTMLQDNGVVLPTGTVDDGDRTLSVQAGSPITSVDDLRALPLLGAAGPVTLGDVADVVVAPVPATSFSRLDGEPALAVALTKTPAGNTVDVSHGAQQAVDDLRAQLGDGVDVAVVFDQAPFIEESIEGLATEGGLGLLFAVVVILLFLASLRSTLVSAVSIPLSLLVTFVGLRLTGYSLNILTLGAMTIAIGRVVDDSIVVIENIKRHLSYGEPKRDAIVTAVREVAAAITASTVATIAVFLPIGLVGGMVGELFRPFAFTTAIALAASLLVSLTIVPVLAYWFVRADAADPAQAERVRAEAEAKERRSWMQRGYLATLRGALAHPVVTIVAALVVFGGTVGLATRLETNFLGDAGQDTLTVTQTFPPATSLEAQDAAARVVEDALADVDGVETVQTTVGSAGGIEAAFSGGGALRATFALTLDAGSDNAAVTDDVRAAVADLPDGTPGDVVVAGADAAFGSSTVDVVVQSDDPDELAHAGEPDPVWLRIDVLTLERHVPALVRVAGIEGVIPGRIGVQRDGHHVRPVIEDVLRAVAMMRIHIQHRHFRPGLQQAACRGGAVVQVAEAAGAVAMGMVAGRSRERVGHATGARHMVRSRQRAMRGPQRRAPGLRPDGAGEVAQVIPGLRHDGRGRAGAPSGGIDAAVVVGRKIGQHFRTGIDARRLQGLPARKGGFQVVQIIRAVHVFQRLAAIVGRRFDLHAAGGQRLLQALRARRQVGGSADAAQPHELPGRMQQLFFGKKRLHGYPRSDRHGRCQMRGAHACLSSISTNTNSVSLGLMTLCSTPTGR